MIDFSRFTFSPVIDLPAQYEVFDFTAGYDPERTLRSSYGIGKYNERRKGMYTAGLFTGGESARDIHVGIDIAAPVNTPVHSFWDGEIFLFGYNPAAGDYGNTLILKYVLGDIELYALYGHLSGKSIAGKRAGQRVNRGEIIAWLGDKHENGNWNPHLHFQLSYVRPTVCDLPGVVAEKDRAEALRIYPDPRLVLGALY
jgi:murein DD-endopeptidase MepM/ murein hydrolase activator NlpD